MDWAGRSKLLSEGEILTEQSTETVHQQGHGWRKDSDGGQDGMVCLFAVYPIISLIALLTT